MVGSIVNKWCKENKGAIMGAVLAANGIGGAISSPHLQDVGLDIKFIAGMVSMHSLTLACFNSLAGFIYDRKGLKITMNVCMVTAIITLFMLALVTNSSIGKIIALFYELFSSLALPLETIMISIYSSDLFGEKSFDKVLGIFISVNSVGFALGEPVVNWCYDILESYRLALLIGSGLYVS